MARQPEKRYAVLVGAAGGLGNALAYALVGQGYDLALLDRDQPALDATREMVHSIGGTAQSFTLDVRSESEWGAVVAALQAAWPRVDLVINAAGVCGAGEVDAFSVEDWRWVVDTNLWGTILSCHALVPWLKRSPGSHLVNIASVAAFLNAPSMGAYNVSKAGVVSLSETLWGELRGFQVGVTVVCPGFFATGLLAQGRFVRPALRGSAERWVRRARITADDVAKAALKGVRRKRLYVVLPMRARVFWRWKRRCPRIINRLMARFYRPHQP